MQRRDLSAADVARLAGVSRAAVGLWVSQPGFPEPVDPDAKRARFDSQAVLAWLEETGRSKTSRSSESAEQEVLEWLTSSTDAGVRRSAEGRSKTDLYRVLETIGGKDGPPPLDLYRSMHTLLGSEGQSVCDPNALAGGAFVSAPELREFAGSLRAHDGLSRAAIRIAEPADTGFSLHYEDALDAAVPDQRYDRVISVPPFGERSKFDRYDERFRWGEPRGTDSTWAWVQHGHSVLGPHGLGAFVVLAGPLFQTSSAQIRENLVRSGSLVAVIALRWPVFRPIHGLEPYILVVANSPRQRVLMWAVDSFDVALPDLSASFDPPDGARLVHFGEIAREDFVLTPARYLAAQGADESALRQAFEDAIVGVQAARLEPTSDPVAGVREWPTSGASTHVRVEDLVSMGVEARLGKGPKTNREGVGLVVFTPRDSANPEDGPTSWTDDPRAGSREVVEEGDLLVSLIQPFTSCVAPRWAVGAALGREVVRIVVPEGAPLSKGWLGWYFRSAAFRAEMDRMLTGGSLARIRFSDFERIEVPLPPLQEQVRITAQLDELAAHRQAVADHLRALDGLIDSVTGLTYNKVEPQRGARV